MMRWASFTERSITVQVLVGIAMVLFCLVFLRFITLTFSEDAPNRTTSVEIVLLNHAETTETESEVVSPYIEMKPFRCGTSLLQMQQRHRQERIVQQELKLRAMQNPEVDETLHNRLGLDDESAPIPIMR